MLAKGGLLCHRIGKTGMEVELVGEAQLSSSVWVGSKDILGAIHHGGESGKQAIVDSVRKDRASSHKEEPVGSSGPEANCD